MDTLFSGKVVKGNQIGRTIGFPTANLQPDTAVKLPKGVFACRVVLPGAENVFLPAMMNVGTRPTVSHTSALCIEVHILDFSGDLYGKTLQVEIVAQIREEHRFAGLDELRQNLEKDRTEARRLLSESSSLA